MNELQRHVSKHLSSDPIVIKGHRRLEFLPGGFQHLVIENCPNIHVVSISVFTKRLLINNCPRLRSIQPWTDGNDLSSLTGIETIYELEELSFQDCPLLCGLPLRLRITDNLCLGGVGSIWHWPRDLMIGGDFRISDCPTMEMLPPLEVKGSLTISGRSGLRRLSPRTIIGRDLDLRPCADLQGVPVDLQVGGLIYLPDHLKVDRVRTAFPSAIPATCAAEPLLEFHEQLRILFQSWQFPALIHTKDLTEAQNRGSACLAKIRTGLRQNPALESLLLGTASEVWEDLNEEAWLQWAPWACERKPANEAFPRQWFLSLIRENEIRPNPVGPPRRRRQVRSRAVARLY